MIGMSSLLSQLDLENFLLRLTTVFAVDKVLQAECTYILSVATKTDQVTSIEKWLVMRVRPNY